MPAKIGAQVAIMKDDKVLLIQREDFEVWALPGGYIDGGESAALAAIREAKEETGLDVRLTGMIGLYSTPEFIGTTLNDHIMLYAAEIIGGTLKGQPEETIDIGFFGKDNLPSPLVCWNERRIHDALDGKRGVSVRLHVESDLYHMPRAEFYAYRDKECARMGISRAEFFANHVKLIKEINDLEVDDLE